MTSLGHVLLQETINFLQKNRKILECKYKIIDGRKYNECRLSNDIRESLYCKLYNILERDFSK